MTEPKFSSLYRAALQHEHFFEQCADPRRRGKAHIVSSMVFEALFDVFGDPEKAWIRKGRPPPRHRRLVGNEEKMQDHEHEASARELRDRIAQMSDKVLRASYRASRAEVGDPWRDALAAAMQERLRRMAFARPNDLANAKSA